MIRIAKRVHVYVNPERDLHGPAVVRTASGDLLLRLESAAGTVDWVDRVRAYRNDVVDDRQVNWLRSEDVVYAEVNPGNKVVELGLSGSIAIGLLAIFFVP